MTVVTVMTQKSELLVRRPWACEQRGSTPPAVERAKLTIGRLRQLGFTACLGPKGALLIADATGKGRDVSRYMLVATMLGDPVAGLADDLGLLDS
jgi:hypothetical protein